MKILLAKNIYYLVRTTLSGALKKLPKDTFVRINRSTVVSIYFIDQINRDHLIIEGKLDGRALVIRMKKEDVDEYLSQFRLINRRRRFSIRENSRYSAHADALGRMPTRESTPGYEIISSLRNGTSSTVSPSRYLRA